MHYSLASFTSTLYNTPLILLTGIQRLSNLHSYLCLMKVTWTLKKTYALKILLVSKALLDSICKIHCSAMKGLSYYNILGGKHSQLCHYLQLNPWSFHTVECYFVFQRMQYLPFHFLLIPFIFILFVHLALLIHAPALFLCCRTASSVCSTMFIQPMKRDGIPTSPGILDVSSNTSKD